MIPRLSVKRVSVVFVFIFCAVLFLTFKHNLVSKAEPKPAALLAPAITATNNDALVVDADGDGIADPGDTIEYTVTVTNGAAVGAGNDATGMIFNDTIDPNMTLVPGSVASSPIAGNDAFNVTGNVSISVPDGANDLLANDIDPDTLSNVGLTASGGTTSAQGGNVAINANGSFTYNLPPGFEGADTFTYTVSDAGGNTGTGTITFNVSGMVWFINNNAAACTTLAAGCGRLSNPFSTLAAFVALNNGAGNNPAANDNIFVFESATAYTGGIGLITGQRLIGQDATATLAAISGITLPAFSAAFPAMNTGAPATTIQGGAGTGVGLNTVGGTNTVRGLSIGTSLPALSGNNFGTLTLDDVSINNNAAAVSLSGGTANTLFDNITTTGGTVGITLTNVGGTVDLGTGAIGGATSNGLNINQGAAVITYAGTITAPAGARPVEIANKTGGSVTLSGLVSSSGTTFGVLLTSNAGPISFTGGLTLNTGGNPGFTATGNTGAITTSSGTITTTTGTAVNIVGTSTASPTPLNMQLTSVSQNGGTNGIILTNTSSSGSPGGFRILGNGGVCTNATPTCTGGTIQNTTANGVFLTSTTNVFLNLVRVLNVASVESGTCDSLDVSGCRGALKMTGTVANPVTTVGLTNVLFSGSGEEGITGFNVRGFRIEDSEVRGFGQTVDENGIHIINLSDTAAGQNLIEDVIINGLATTTPAPSAGIHIRNTASTVLNDLSIRRGTIRGVEDGVRLTVRDASNSSFLVTNVSMPGELLGDGIDLAVGNSGDTNPIGNIIVQNNTLENSGFGFGGIVLAAIERGRGTWTVRDNTIRNNGGTAINIAPWSRFNTTTAVVARNNIDCPGGDGTIPGNTNTANPCRVGIGISVSKEDGGGAGENGVGQVYVDSNTISRAAVAVGGIIRTGLSAGGRLDIRARNNVFTNNTGNPAILDEPMQFDAGSAGGPTGTLCLNIGTANSPAGGNNNSAPSAFVGGDSYRIRERVGATFQLQGISNGSSAPTTDTFVATNNQTSGASPATVFVSSTGGVTYDGGTCTTPTEVGPVSFTEVEGVAKNTFDSDSVFRQINYRTPSELLASIEPFVKSSASAETSVEEMPETNDANYPATVLAFLSELKDKLGAAISPTVTAQETKDLPVNISGETIIVGAPGGFTLPASKAVTIKFRATIDNVSGLTQVSNQGTITGSNFANVLTDDPSVAGAANPTVTLVDRTTVAVTSSQNPSVVGQPVTFTANLAGSPVHASGNPTGTVQFFNGATPIGSPIAVTAGAVNTGSAQIIVSDLTAASHTITAQYSGGGQFNAGTGSLTGNPQVVSNTAVWDGSASANWDTAANWTTNFAPLSGNDVTIPTAGVTNNPTISATDISVNSLNEQSGRTLTVNSGRTLTVSGACTINGTLTVAGAFTCGSFSGTGTVNFTGAAAQNVPPLPYQNLTINNASGVNLSADTTVNGVLTLTSGNINAGANNLILGGTATVSRTSGHVIGNILKTFNAASSFAFPTGTANGFSPATVNVTAGTFPLSFNVRAVQGPQPLLSAANSLQRYWQVSPTGGNPTANLTFNYLQTDVAGTETSYRIVRINGTQIFSLAHNPPNVVIDTTNNIATVNGVTAFSDWTLGALVPTAANVNVSGRVVTAEGRAVFNAEVVMVGSNGQLKTARTNPFGYFRFSGIPAGENYTMSVKHKLYEFAPQVISITDEVSEIIFVASQD